MEWLEKNLPSHLILTIVLTFAGAFNSIFLQRPLLDAARLVILRYCCFCCGYFRKGELRVLEQEAAAARQREEHEREAARQLEAAALSIRQEVDTLQHPTNFVLLSASVDWESKVSLFLQIPMRVSRVVCCNLHITNVQVCSVRVHCTVLVSYEYNNKCTVLYIQ